MDTVVAIAEVDDAVGAWTALLVRRGRRPLEARRVVGRRGGRRRQLERAPRSGRVVPSPAPAARARCLRLRAATTPTTAAPHHAPRPAGALSTRQPQPVSSVASPASPPPDPDAAEDAPPPVPTAPLVVEDDALGVEVHAPATQTPSGHGVPSGFTALAHAPVAGSQAPAS
jgi:hypothetical protein